MDKTFCVYVVTNDQNEIRYVDVTSSGGWDKEGINQWYPWLLFWMTCCSVDKKLLKYLNVVSGKQIVQKKEKALKWFRML